MKTGLEGIGIYRRDRKTEKDGLVGEALCRDGRGGAEGKRFISSETAECDTFRRERTRRVEEGRQEKDLLNIPNRV